MGSNERNIYKQNEIVERKNVSIFSEYREKRDLEKTEEVYKIAVDTAASPITGRKGIPGSRGY